MAATLIFVLHVTFIFFCSRRGREILIVAPAMAVISFELMIIFLDLSWILYH